MRLNSLFLSYDFFLAYASTKCSKSFSVKFINLIYGYGVSITFVISCKVMQEVKIELIKLSTFSIIF